jgi:DNA polymerase I-like protein with 3'-5' exonuclease and polymerase domains
VALDNAIKCPPPRKDGKVKIKPTYITCCRPYLYSTFQDVKPTRVIVLGNDAAKSVVGRGVPSITVRKGYTWSFEYGCPVFFVMDPAFAMHNDSYREWFEEDMQHALTWAPPPPVWDARAGLVESEQDAKEALEVLATADWVSFDVEAAGLMFNASYRLLSASFTAKVDNNLETFVWTSRGLNTAFNAYKKILESSIPKVGANIRYDGLANQVLYGIHLNNIISDVRLEAKLLDAECSGKLEALAERVGMGGCKEEQEAAMLAGVNKVNAILRSVRTKGANEFNLGLLRAQGIDDKLYPVVNGPYDYEAERWSYAVVEKNQLYSYNARDTLATALVKDSIQPQMEANEALSTVWNDIVLPANEAFQWVEYWGFGVSIPDIMAFSASLDNDIAQAEEKLNEIANRIGCRNVNWRSAAQVGPILFDKLKLPVIEYTNDNEDTYATGGDVLEALVGKHAIIEHLLAFRKADKLQYFGSGMLPHVREDSRIHTSILLDGARSGRSSSIKPNLQNIPKIARKYFVASPGNLLVQLDYKQLELVIAAMVSGDPEMCRIFREGIDFHRFTANVVSQLMWGIPPEAVTGDHRSKVKPVVFGKLYGKTDETLAKDLGCSVATARKVIGSIFDKFSILNRWCKDIQREATRTGVTHTYWNKKKARMRCLPHITSNMKGLRITAENGSYNTPIQGTANDFLLVSLVQIIRRILQDKLPARVCITVHDSIVMEVEQSQAYDVARMAKKIMESQPSAGADVPLTAEVEIGQSWGQLVKVNL